MATVVSLPQPHVRPIYTIHTDHLSAAAGDYLRGVVRDQLRAGASKRDAAHAANVWCAGYRAFKTGAARADQPGLAQDGWDYAHGEDAWLQCRYIDACQDSAAAADWPASALW